MSGSCLRSGSRQRISRMPTCHVRFHSAHLPIHCTGGGGGQGGFILWGGDTCKTLSCLRMCIIVYKCSCFRQDSAFCSHSMYTVIKRLAVFPFPARMSLTKLFLAGNNLTIPCQGELVSDIPAGDGKPANLFLVLQCTSWNACEECQAK